MLLTGKVNARQEVSKGLNDVRNKENPKDLILEKRCVDGVGS